MKVGAFPIVHFIHTLWTVFALAFIAHNNNRILVDFHDTFAIRNLAGLFIRVFMRQSQIFTLFELLFELNRQPVEKFTLLVYPFATPLLRTDHVLKSINFVGHIRCGTSQTEHVPTVGDGNELI
jgi:hypothetical protein